MRHLWIIAVLLLIYLHRPVFSETESKQNNLGLKLPDPWRKWWEILTRFFQTVCTLNTFWDLFGGKFFTSAGTR
uniref:Uncharacterized protein n=1 Tax=Trichobilharzia regenti TaxID=157069 RepID=A0AA85IYA5_TRIRE|nr:unnamed protein product [Trichobilharzia regenti]